MKKIGISFTKTNFTFYWNWITPEDRGQDIELVELSFEKNNLADLHSCDAVILTGGIDIDPAFYAGETAYDHMPHQFQTDRDRFEATVYHYARTHNLPVLAICRGLQLVNVLHGGKLVQDLGSTSNSTHKKEEADKEHSVFVEKDSLLKEITGNYTGLVNSAHHQAALPQLLGDDLMVSARADDGTIEGIELAQKHGKAFMLCVQWHPERMREKENSPFSQNIKEKFLEATRHTHMTKLTIQNPATEEVIATLNEDNESTIAEKFKILKKGQPAWSRTPVEKRVACIRKFCDLLDAEKDSLAQTLTSEMGKPLKEAYNELNGAKARMQYFLDNSEKWLTEEWVVKEGGTKEKITYEPLGIIGNISAWNYPYLVGVNVFIPALIGGNGVFYKPSEYSTLTGLAIQRLLYQAGIPEDVFQIVIGKGAAGEALLNLPLNGYFFTGSYRTGKYIAEKVAHKLVPCQLELGGKDPLYVADDIDDVNKAAGAALEGVVYNNGQSCCAVERIYVHEKIYDQFVNAFVDQAKKLQVGDPLNKTTDIGPLSRQSQVEFLLEQIRDAESKGAKLLTGGRATVPSGYFIKPAVLVNVNHSMKIMTEESFGPVVGIQPVKNDEEAVALMQETEYGLTAAVYSKDFSRAEHIMAQMNTGTVYWNCCDRVSGALPWSGRKHSGLGSTLSYQGIRAFVQPKSWHIRP